MIRHAHPEPETKNALQTAASAQSALGHRESRKHLGPCVTEARVKLFQVSQNLHKVLAGFPV